MTIEYATLEERAGNASQYRILVRDTWSDGIWRISADYGPIYSDIAATNLAEMLNKEEQ